MKKVINDSGLEEGKGKRLPWQSNGWVEWSCKMLVERVIMTSERLDEKRAGMRKGTKLPYRYCFCLMRLANLLHVSLATHSDLNCTYTHIG